MEVQLINILLVEDNPAMRELIEEIFLTPNLINYKLLTSETLSQAIDLSTKEAIDIVLLDLGLSDSDGIETLKTFRKNHPEILVIVLTGYDDDTIGREAIACGAQDYLIKGSGMEIMLPRICLYALERHKLQAEAKRSEQFLRSTIDSLSTHIALIDKNGTILLVNNAWQNFVIEHGGDPDMLCEGANYLSTVLPNNLKAASLTASATRGIQQVILGEKEYFEIEYPCHSSTEKQWFLLRATPFENASTQCAVIAHENITKQKTSESKLLTSKQYLRIIFDTSPNLTFVKDIDQKYVMVNKSYSEFLNIPYEKIIGKTDKDLFLKHPSPASDISHFSEADQELMYKGKGILTKETTLLNHAGQKKHYRFYKTPIFFPDRPTAMLAIGLDITALRNSQKGTQESEHRMRTILDAMHQSITLHDQNMDVIWANKQAAQSKETLTCFLNGCNFDQNTHETALCKNCPPRKALTTKRIQVETVTLESGKIIRITGCPVISTSNKITAVVCISEDISIVHSLEQQLRQAQKMESLGTLAGGIAHDFNNILTAILGFTEISLHSRDHKEDLDESLNEIYKASIRARDLVHQILTFSRRIEQPLNPLEISLIIKEALKLLRASLPATIEVKTTIENNENMVLADPTQIHQIIMNLCTNAAHAMNPDGGVLEVTLSHDQINEDTHQKHPILKSGNYLKLQIKDTGCGIPEHHLPSIFEPYFTTKSHGEGTGLGLSVVHGIVNECGGGIYAESTLGEGTTFTILLPQWVGDKKRKDEDEKNISPSGAGYKILVFDDEPGITLLCKRILESDGYKTICEEDPTKLLPQILTRELEADLILTDMTMPKITGEKIFRQLRENNINIPVVIMSGNSLKLPEDLKGAEGLLLISKPLTKKYLLGKIHNFLLKNGISNQGQSISIKEDL